MTRRIWFCGFVALLVPVLLSAQPEPDPVPAPSTHRVCASGCAFSTLQAAITAAKPGDTVRLAAEVFKQCAVVPSSKAGLTITGDGDAKHGTGAHLTATTCLQKGAIVVQADNVTIENLEISGIAAGSGNGAAIRNEAPNLTIRNNYLHDSQTAYLGGNAANSGILLIESNRFERNGLDGPSHNIYISKQSAHAIVRYNTIVDTTGGHSVKCGAKRCEIIENIIGGSAFRMSSAINVQLGGTSLIQGNWIEKGIKSINPWILSIANEPQNGIYPEEIQDHTVRDNTFVNRRTTGTAVKAVYSSSGGVVNGTEYPVIPIPVKLLHNTFYGVSSVVDAASVGLRLVDDAENVTQPLAQAPTHPVTQGATPHTLTQTDTVSLTVTGPASPSASRALTAADIPLATITYSPIAEGVVYTAPHADYACNGGTWFKCVWTKAVPVACGQVVIPAISGTWVRVDAGGASPIVQVP